MEILLAGSFQRDFKKLNARSSIFEARVGLGMRLAFALQDDSLIFHRIGDHDTIRRFLKNF